MIVTDRQDGALRRWVLMLALLYWAAAFIGTHRPSETIPKQTPPDKVLHLLAYGGLALLLSWAELLRCGLSLAVPGRVLAILTLYAAFDEWTQTFVAGRNGDVQDWLADISGAGLGVSLVYGAILATRSWKESRAQQQAEPRARASEQIGS